MATADGILVKRVPLISVVGGSTATRLDPQIDNAYVTQASAFLEREVSADVGVRTGVVVNMKRQWQGTTNISRPLDAYAAPVSIVDPGPDGRPGTADDGATLTARQLTAESLAAAPVNLTTNLPGSDSEYYTWELSATRRPRASWSLMASVTHTWSREAVFASGTTSRPMP